MIYGLEKIRNAVQGLFWFLILNGQFFGQSSNDDNKLTFEDACRKFRTTGDLDSDQLKQQLQLTVAQFIQQCPLSGNSRRRREVDHMKRRRE